MLTLDSAGLYCPNGKFHIDPMRPVETAVVTHAHADHARRGSKVYYTPKSGVGLLKARLGKNITVRGIPYGEKFQLDRVILSFHPAGHILGSAQVRMEQNGEVWVASGDYKRDPDPTCEPFEIVKCDVFITEATFGTPSFQWDKAADPGTEIFEWWEENAREGKNSFLSAYSLGKTQRVLGLLHPFTDRNVYCAPQATPLNQCYREEGIALAKTICLSELDPNRVLKGELLIGPPSFLKSSQASMLGENYTTAFASGWMAQGDRGFERGFVLSDHADWNDLLRTIRETGAQRVYVQHRGSGALVRHLRNLGLEAFPDSAIGEVREPVQLSFFSPTEERLS